MAPSVSRCMLACWCSCLSLSVSGPGPQYGSECVKGSPVREITASLSGGLGCWEGGVSRPMDTGGLRSDTSLVSRGCRSPQNDIGTGDVDLPLTVSQPSGSARPLGNWVKGREGME